MISRIARGSILNTYKIGIAVRFSLLFFLCYFAKLFSGEAIAIFGF